jgi:hypothetical protein
MWFPGDDFPDAEEHAQAILEAVEGDYKQALEHIQVLREFGVSDDYCRRIEALLTPKGES